MAQRRRRIKSSLPPSWVEAAARVVMAFYKVKDPQYGSSWCRRGAQGIFHNVARKFDRIEHQILSGRAARIDDALDLAAYAVMQLGWYLRGTPAAQVQRLLTREGVWSTSLGIEIVRKTAAAKHLRSSRVSSPSRTHPRR